MNANADSPVARNTVDIRFKGAGHAAVSFAILGNLRGIETDGFHRIIVCRRGIECRQTQRKRLGSKLVFNIPRRTVIGNIDDFVPLVKHFAKPRRTVGIVV